MCEVQPSLKSSLKTVSPIYIMAVQTAETVPTKSL